MKKSILLIMLFFNYLPSVSQAQKNNLSLNYQLRLLEIQQNAIQSWMKDQYRMQTDEVRRAQTLSGLQAELYRLEAQKQMLSGQTGVNTNNNIDPDLSLACSRQIEVMTGLEAAGITKPVARTQELINSDLSRNEILKKLTDQFHVPSENATNYTDKIVWIRDQSGKLASPNVKSPAGPARGSKNNK